MRLLPPFAVEDLDQPIMLKAPNWAAFAAWYDEAFARDEKGDADHNLVIACAHEPGAEGLAAIFDDGFGLLAASLADELLEAAGCPGGWVGAFIAENRLPILSLKEAEDKTSIGKSTCAGCSGEGKIDGSTCLGCSGFGTVLNATVPSELIVKAREKTRRPFFIQLPSGAWWAFKAPGTSEGARFQTDSMRARRGEMSVSAVGRSFVLKCVLFPSREVAEAEIDDMPGIVPRIVPSLKEKGGEGKARALAKG